MSEKNGKKAAMKASKKKIKQLRKPKLVQTKAKEQSAKVGAKRKRAAEDSDDDDDNSDDEDKDEDELDLQVKDGEVVKEGAYTFEFSDVRDAFYGGIQLMLTKQVYSTGTAHDFAEVICKQDELGTVVHCEGEEDVFAYATILPSSKISAISFIQQLATYIEHHAQSAATQDCKRILNAIAQQTAESSKYGLLLHDRFVNIPLELIYQLHRNLSDDLTWILDPSKRGTEIAEDLLSAFDAMEQIVIFRPCAPDSDSSSSSSSNKVEHVTGSSSIMFDYFEDDVYFEHADLAFKLKLDTKFFKVSNYVMMVIPKRAIPNIVDGLQKLLNC